MLNFEVLGFEETWVIYFMVFSLLDSHWFVVELNLIQLDSEIHSFFPLAYQIPYIIINFTLKTLQYCFEIHQTYFDFFIDLYLYSVQKQAFQNLYY